MAESGNEERIKAIAHRVYLNRQMWRRSGDAHEDWQTATTIAEKPLKRLLFWSHSGLLALPKLGYRSAKFVVWEIPKWGLFSLPKLEWVKLLAVPLVVAAAGSIITRNFQREAEQNRILKEYFALLETFTFEQGLLDEPLDSGVVLLARGRTVATLRELDLSRRMQLIAFLQASHLATMETYQNFEGFQEPTISFKAQDLSKIDLRKINIFLMDFRFASFQRANLQDSFIASTNFQGANFQGANLQGAGLYIVDFQNATLISANLKEAYLINVNLQNASLSGANLQNASLDRANLQDAFVGDANLQGTNLQEANLKGVNLKQVSGLAKEQLIKAKLCQTVLPKNIDLDSDRDCNSP